MELSFVIAALRRRLWLVALMALLGLLGAVAFTGRGAAQFEAVSELLVQPQTSATGIASSSDPDRFIAGEVVSLKGSAFADQIVQQVPGTSRSMLASTVIVEQTAKTNVVKIIVRVEDPTLAQQIANAYATTYIAESEEREGAGYADEIAEIDKQLEELSKRISDIEVQRAQFPPNSPNVADRTRDAELFQQTSSYRAQYTQLLGTQTNLRYSSTLKSRSEILQLAPLPTEPMPSSKVILVGAGGFLGLVLGSVIAVAWANSSRRLLDVTQLEEILGAQAVGVLPLDRRLAADPKVAFEALPDSASALIDQLCVRAESSAQGETDALTVAVVGSSRGAGATTVALAMAGRLARNGARTVVIDADIADPEISRSFQALDDAGIPGLLARLAAARKEQPAGAVPSTPETMPARVFTPTTLPDVRVLGVGAGTRARSLHRTNVDMVIEASARGGVDVVVIDGGPLLDAASTVRLCQVVDVVVLVVPVGQQLIEPLGVINRLLGYRSGDLLPVATKLKPKQNKSSSPPQPTADDDADDILEAATRWRPGTERNRPAADGPATDAAPSRPDAPMPASPRLGAPPAPRRRVAFTPLDDPIEPVEPNPTELALKKSPASWPIPPSEPLRGLPAATNGNGANGNGNGAADGDDVEWVAPRPEQ